MPRCNCGKTVDSWNGARGHVQFTEGGGHGEQGDVPDDWRAMFDEAEEPEDDEDDEEPAADGATDEEVAEAVEEQERDSGESEASQSNGLTRRLRLALTDDVRHLWGDGE